MNMKRTFNDFVKDRHDFVERSLKEQAPELFYEGKIKEETLYKLETENLGFWIWWELKDSYETSA